MKDKTWSPKAWPKSAAAAEAIKVYLASEQEDFYGIKLNFKGANLSGLSPQECWVTYANFTDCILEAVDFSGAQATDAMFIRSKMMRADVSKAVVARSTFDGADLSSSNMTRIDATNASFVGANLTNATLIDADLREANLTSVDLTGCNLNWAIFDNTILSGATVTGATGTVRGAAVVEISPKRQTLSGSQLEQWFAKRGAAVKVESAAP